MPDRILDRRTRFAGVAGDHHVTPIALVAEGTLARMIAAGAVSPEVRLGSPADPRGRSVAAEVNAAELEGEWSWQGRWIARCPDCSGAEYVDFDTPVFMCCNCFNRANGYAWRPVATPNRTRRAEIEELLIRRPARNRSWLASETLDDLREQNRRMKV